MLLQSSKTPGADQASRGQCVSSSSTPWACVNRLAFTRVGANGENSRDQGPRIQRKEVLIMLDFRLQKGRQGH